MTSHFKRLQGELQRTAVELLVEARASALALSLEDDPDGYWIAIGPKPQIRFLFGSVGDVGHESRPEEPKQQTDGAGSERRRTLQ